MQNNIDDLHIKLDRYEIFECSIKHKGGIVPCRIPILMPEVGGDPLDVPTPCLDTHILNKDDVSLGGTVTVSNYLNLFIPPELVDEILENGVYYDPKGTRYIGFFIAGDISRSKIVYKEGR